MHPEYPDFALLEAARGQELAPWLALAPRPICDLSLVNLCIWQECERASYTFIHRHLCILIQPHNQPVYFLEPLGSAPALDAARRCLEHAGRISCSGETLAAGLPHGMCQVTPLRDHFDYIYTTAELAELKGNKHDGKRNQIKKFTRNHPGHRLVPLAGEHRDQALQVFDRWSQERPGNADGNGDPAAEAAILCQRLALQRAFADYEVLGLNGLAVFAADAMLGFALGSALNAETAVIHFMYADSERRGIYQLLLQESCRTVFSGFPLINLEEDLGIPTLRRTKLSYNPLRLEKKFLLTSKTAPSQPLFD